MDVSILVLMDLPFLRASGYHYDYFDAGVSILVLMDLPFLLEGLKMISFFDERVSILVLMDLPFLQTVNSEYAHYVQTFQSLFLWIFRSYALHP